MNSKLKFSILKFCTGVKLFSGCPFPQRWLYVNIWEYRINVVPTNFACGSKYISRRNFDCLKLQQLALQITDISNYEIKNVKILYIIHVQNTCTKQAPRQVGRMSLPGFLVSQVVTVSAFYDKALDKCTYTLFCP